MMRPKLLDLFCCAGGASVGYHRAGFDVTGVDIKPQKNYPFQFFQADALEFVREHGHEYDAIAASPPCQIRSALKSLHRHKPSYARHLDLIPQTRAALRATGRPYVIENVPGADLIEPVRLCGTMFDLKVYRHRLFECSFPVPQPPHNPHRDTCPGVGRGISPRGFISVTGTGGFGVPDGFRYACDAMGIDWMKRAELSQAIPPAYTEHIGNALMAHLCAATVETR